jgi:signal transduction histidine kinase
MQEGGVERTLMGLAARWRPIEKSRRIASSPYRLAVVGSVLATASFAQAAVQGARLGALYALPLCLLALAATVPLIFLRPLAAALCITAASVMPLAAFGVVTVGAPSSGVVTAGLATAGSAAAQVISVYRLAAVGPGPAGAAESAGWRANAPFLALGLTIPFLALMLAGRGGVDARLLASLVPAAAGAAIAVRSRRAASLQGAVRTELADALVEHMARGERARIARELHDVVAHHISMISVQAETARITVDLPPEGARWLRDIGDTARAGLTEMRRLLGVLRPDTDPVVPDQRQPQPGLRQLTSLITDTRAASAGAVRLIVSGPVTSFDPGVELAAYRIVQEALTNARRHAPGAAVDVELHYDVNLLRLRIRDNGPGHGDRTAGSGHGLLGMRERALTVGGTFRTGAAPGGGFLVEAELPAQPDDES